MVFANELSKNDARKLAEWWNANSPDYFFVEKMSNVGYKRPETSCWQVIRQESCPEHGYIVWDGRVAYRATAVAYMEREGLSEVSHKNGNSYSLELLRKNLIGYEKL